MYQTQGQCINVPRLSVNSQWLIFGSLRGHIGYLWSKSCRLSHFPLVVYMIFDSVQELVVATPSSFDKPLGMIYIIRWLFTQIICYNFYLCSV